MPLRRGFNSPMRRMGPRRGGAKGLRLIIALFMVGAALVSYLGSSEYNPVTGEKQHVALAPHQEIALGLRAAPSMVQQHGGLYADEAAQRLVDRVGIALVQNSVAGQTDWEFDFHLLADASVVNAFALPGGQCFITYALYSQLESEGQLAGVMGHEIGHVVARHGSQRLAKSKLTQGLTGAVAVAAENASQAMVAQMVGQMLNMKYGREDELESDMLGVRFMVDAGYDPRSMTGVMRILEKAAGGKKPPEFMSTHPDPGNRVERIEAAVREIFPNGVPEGLRP